MDNNYLFNTLVLFPIFIIGIASKYSKLNNIFKTNINSITKRKNKKEKPKKIIKKYFQKNFVSIINFIILISIVESNPSKIILNIKGTGIKNIFSVVSSHNFYRESLPNKIFINGKEKTPVYSYQFDEENNEVELIWNNKLKNCEDMLYGCSDITKIDLSNFDSSEVNNIINMFSGCSSLVSLDLTNFQTKNVDDLEGVFSECTSLTSLDLSSFDTSNVNDMSIMFYNCFSLTLLNLTNFKTDGVMLFASMFYNCTSLSSLNLSNFNFRNSLSIMYFFKDCINLEYINIKKYEKTNSLDIGIFSNTPDNFVICVSNRNTGILTQLQDKKCYIIDCSDNWREKQKKLIAGSDYCPQNCKENSQYEYNGKCLPSCEKGVIIENNLQANKCKCE